MSWTEERPLQPCAFTLLRFRYITHRHFPNTSSILITKGRQPADHEYESLCTNSLWSFRLRSLWVAQPVGLCRWGRGNEALEGGRHKLNGQKGRVDNEAPTSSPDFSSIFGPCLLLSGSSVGHGLKRNRECELVPFPTPSPCFSSPVYTYTYSVFPGV